MTIGGISMKYKVVLFDFDYTLAFSEKGILMCFKHVLENHEYEGISDDKIKYTIGMTLEDAFQYLTGVEDMAVLLSYKKEYIQKADEVMTRHTELYPETIPALRRLREQDIQIGIISTKMRYRIAETFKLYEISDWITLVVGGEDVEKHKPDPEGLLYAIKKLGVKNEEVLYIGDNIIDAKTAQNAGVDFIGVTTGTTTKEDFREYPSIKIIQSLDEL